MYVQTVTMKTWTYTNSKQSSLPYNNLTNNVITDFIIIIIATIRFNVTLNITSDNDTRYYHEHKTTITNNYKQSKQQVSRDELMLILAIATDLVR